MNEDSLIPLVVSVSDLQRDYARLLRKAKTAGCPLFVLRKNKLELVLTHGSLFEKTARKARLYEELQALEAVAGYEEEKKRGKLKKMKNVKELFA